jgi:hypothetical protein
MNSMRIKRKYSRRGFCMNLGLQNYVINRMLICRQFFFLSFSIEDLDPQLHLRENFDTIINQYYSNFFNLD